MIKKALITATVQSHIAQFHKPLIHLLRNNGYVVDIAGRDNLKEKNGLKIEDVSQAYDVPFSRSPKSKDNITAYKQLKHIIDEGQYDVIHCNTPMGGIVTRLAARDARKRGTKVIYTAHGFHFFRGASKLAWLVYYPIEKFFCRYTDTLITINREDFQLASTRFYVKCTYMHGVGVDEDRYYPANSDQEVGDLKSELGIPSDRFIMLCIGELLPNKNQRMAINVVADVVKKYPNVLLFLAGNGPEKENIERYIAERGLSNNVKMLGYCTCLEKYQKVSDILLACSYREGLPLNLIEAMLSGNPVIATHNRGHNELIDNGRNGFLVNPDDAIAMGEHIIDFIEHPDKRQQMGKEAINVGQQYGKKVITEELKNIYNL